MFRNAANTQPFNVTAQGCLKRAGALRRRYHATMLAASSTGPMNDYTTPPIIIRQSVVATNGEKTPKSLYISPQKKHKHFEFPVIKS